MPSRIAPLIAFVLSAAALAEEPPVAEVGFAGLYRGGPVPLRVPLSNEGPDDEVGDIVVTVNDGIAQARYAVRVDLPRGSKKSVVVHVWFEETSLFSSVTFPATVTWNPIGRPAREIAAPNTTELKLGDNLVLYSSGDPIERGISLPGLSGRSTSPSPVVVPPKIASNPSITVTSFSVGGVTHQAAVEPSRVPDLWYDLSSADLLYLRKIGDRDISPEQMEAVSAWVESGGEVLVSGGSAPLGPLARFVPGTIKGKTAKSSFNAFTRTYGEVKSEPHELSVLSPEAGADVACQEGDLPLVTYARRGAGGVAFLSFDPLAEPFRSSAGLAKLWDSLIARSGRHRSAFADRHFQQEVVELLGARQGPTVGTVIAGAAVLVLFLAGLWWIHRRIATRPTELAVAVFASPLLALLLAGLAWILGLFSRGGDRHDAVVFVQAAPGAHRAVVRSFDAFWHGGAGTFGENALAKDSLCCGEVSPLFDPRKRPRFTWREEAPPRLADTDFYPNSSRIFDSLFQADLEEGIVCTLTRSPSGLEGQLRNRSPWDWRDVRVLSIDGEASLGNLPRGQGMTTPSPIWLPASKRPEAEVTMMEMTRRGKLHDGLAERIRGAWAFPATASASNPGVRGDLLLVAFIDPVPVWSAKEGRKESQETVLVVPLVGSDRSGGTGR